MQVLAIAQSRVNASIHKFVICFYGRLPYDTIWLFNIAMENPLYMEVLMGKSSINGPFSMAMLNNQRVTQGVTNTAWPCMARLAFFC